MKIRDKFNHEKVFFTADTHFYHKNIIRYSNRPFNDLNHMHEQLITRWNTIVPPDGTVFHLGDIVFGEPKQLKQIVARLNGNIYICRGNHDRDKTLLSSFHISRIEDVWEIQVEEQKLFLSHYAHKVWKGSHKGTWHLYGHSHGSLPDDKYSHSMDVGVDTNDYCPYRYSDVEKIMLKKEFKPLDHHGKRIDE